MSTQHDYRSAYGQAECRWCGSKVRYLPCRVSPEVKATIAAFAAEHGRTWKAALRALWNSGRDEGNLRWARNSLGPSRLDRIDQTAIEKIRAELTPGKGDPMTTPMSKCELIERAVVRHLVERMAEHGWKPKETFDGEEYVTTKTVEQVLETVFSVEDSTVSFVNGAGKILGVKLICGNEEDIISDYHVGTPEFEAAMNEVTAWIEKGSYIMGATTT